jgi:hypothetical protein
MLGRVSSEGYLQSYCVHIHNRYSLSQTKLENAQKALKKSLLRGKAFYTREHRNDGTMNEQMAEKTWQVEI